MSIKQMDTLYKRSSEEFDELINDVLQDAERNDKTYHRLSEINKGLRRKYPNLMKIYETENPKKLTEKEIDSLMTILNNEFEMKYIIYEKMFMAGNKEAYYYFKRMGILKEEDNN